LQPLGTVPLGWADSKINRIKGGIPVKRVYVKPEPSIAAGMPDGRPQKAIPAIPYEKWNFQRKINTVTFVDIFHEFGVEYPACKARIFR
jgi:hypothetical protein